VRVCEEHTAASQFIEMRCAGLRMTAKCADPVIQIVNGDEKNIRTCDEVGWLWRALAPVQREKRKQTGARRVCSHHVA
jgi:hypothetical protein